MTSKVVSMTGFAAVQGSFEGCSWTAYIRSVNGRSLDLRLRVPDLDGLEPELRKRLDVQRGAEQLARYFGASVELMQVMARACGHDSLSGFTPRDVTSWKRDTADLAGIRFAGPA